MNKNMASNFFGAFGIADDFMKKTDVIIQSESYDNSTDTILMWLHHYGTFNKIHLFFNNYVVDHFSLLFSGQKKKSVKINNIILNNCSFWYRRGEYTVTANHQNESFKKNIENIALIPLISYLNRFFQNSYINLFNDNFINKITVLEHCLDLGIKIPNTLITTHNEDLLLFLSKNKTVITKSIQNPFFTQHINKNYKIYFSTPTQLVTLKDISEKNSSFLPSFFQKYIPKQFEIRSFYLNGTFKSMAIFSQQSEKTKTDYRNYDHQNPNRCVPYLLPKKLEKKLHQLMLKLKLNCGSFDIIYTPEGKHYFLEVNPIGQFQWLSRNCNYFIEKIITKQILRNGKADKKQNEKIYK